MEAFEIVPMGGGGFYDEGADSKLDEWLLSRVDSPSPNVCFIPTASGDSTSYLVEFYDAFNRHDATPTHLKLFSRSIDDLEGFLSEQDIIYVGGGNTANMLEIWRIHGVDEALQKAAASGSILTGPSAGGICWFESGVTDSFGTELAPLHGGLGCLEGSFCPHFDGEADREPKYKKMLRAQKLQAGYAVDDGAALHFIGGDLKGVIAEKPEAGAYFMKADGSEIKTQNLETDVLG